MAANPDFIEESITKFTLNGESLEAIGDETILQAAERSGVEIPHLCYKDWIGRSLTESTDRRIFHCPGQFFQ